MRFCNMSFAKRIHNEVQECENNSDHKVPYDSYYMVCISCETDIEKKEKFVKTLFSSKYQAGGISRGPCLIYTRTEDLYILFSCLDNESSLHFLKGSHSAITSHFACEMYKFSGKTNTVKIVELPTRTKVLTYLFWKAYEHQRLFAVSASNGSLNKRDVMNMTTSELALRVKGWEELPANKRFGCFYKVDNNGNLATLSDNFTYPDMEKQSAFFFS